MLDRVDILKFPGMPAQNPKSPLAYRLIQANARKLLWGSVSAVTKRAIPPDLKQCQRWLEEVCQIAIQFLGEELVLKITIIFSSIGSHFYGGSIICLAGSASK